MANTPWDQILIGLSITPTANAANALAAWAQSEGGLSEYVTPGNQASGSINNPFNITWAYGQPAGNTGTQGDIKVFKTLDSGIQATIAWFKGSSYLQPVVAALRTGNVQQIYQAVNSVSGI